jgi:hypothetical protein
MPGRNLPGSYFASIPSEIRESYIFVKKLWIPVFTANPPTAHILFAFQRSVRQMCDS